MNPKETALILIGYQNDYFSPEGVLHQVFQEDGAVDRVRDRTLALLEALRDTPVTLISTPICFTPDYQEIAEPVGILEVIKETGAFQAGAFGSETIPELKRFGQRIVEVPGKRGLNAFMGTHLGEVLRERGIQDVVLAGAVTTICIDSTGRSAFEQGFRVHVLEDCTLARSAFEQRFYCEQIFPLYAQVLDSGALLTELGVEVDAA